MKELTELVNSAGAEKWINIITANFISNFDEKSLSTNIHGREKK